MSVTAEKKAEIIADNARAKGELGWRPAFPTYREGLSAILQAGG